MKKIAILILLVAPMVLFSCKTAPKEAEQEDTQNVQTEKQTEAPVAEKPEPAPEKEPEKPVEEEPAEVVTESQHVMYFAPESAVIDGLVAYKLDALAEDIRMKGIRDVKVVGHSAKLDTVKQEKNISRQRALAVAEYLQNLGVPENGKIRVEGMGAEEPVASHTDITKRGMNRRVEVIY